MYIKISFTGTFKMSIDKRILKTRTSIKKAFMALVESSDMTKITVSELAAKAMVNRSTFYLHYEDVAAVAADIENAIATKIGELISEFDISNIYDSTFTLFKKLTSKLEELPEIKNYIIYSTNSSYIVGRIKHIFVEKTTETLMKKAPEISPEESEYPFTFAAAGIIDSYVKWVRTAGNKPSLESLINTVSELTDQILLKFSK